MCVRLRFIFVGPTPDNFFYVSAFSRAPKVSKRLYFTSNSYDNFLTITYDIDGGFSIKKGTPCFSDAPRCGEETTASSREQPTT